MSTDPFDPDSGEALGALAARVREASRAGDVVPLSEAWQGTEDALILRMQEGAGAGIDDIVLIRESGRAYLYSELHMAGSYAECAARACGNDPRHVIAETVRHDSRTYPRPTPAATFLGPPFRFSQDALTRAMEEITRDPNYADVLLLRASNGSLFLFSSLHLHPGHAESLAEWMAVGHLQNP